LSRLSYANVMATAAVFVALLGGGALAAFKVPKGSVGAKQLKAAAVTPPKVAPKTITLFKGQKGDRGDKGNQGDPGSAGPTAGFASYSGGVPPSPATTVYSAAFNLPTAGKLFINATNNVSITCGAADCGEYFEIQVDGSPLPSSGVGFIDGQASSTKYEGVNVVGVTGLLTAGSHTVTLKRDRNYGTPSPVISDFGNEQTIAAVLLGS
jgi:hypothetical protein